jgi:hypothetical protein
LCAPYNICNVQIHSALTPVNLLFDKKTRTGAGFHARRWTQPSQPTVEEFISGAVEPVIAIAGNIANPGAAKAR